MITTIPIMYTLTYKPHISRNIYALTEIVFMIGLIGSITTDAVENGINGTHYMEHPMMTATACRLLCHLHDYTLSAHYKSRCLCMQPPLVPKLYPVEDVKLVNDNLVPGQPSYSILSTVSSPVPDQTSERTGQPDLANVYLPGCPTHIS